MSQEENVSPKESQDLDSLLSEYEESSTETVKEVKEPDVSAKVQQLEAELEEMRQVNIAKDTRTALEEAVSEITKIGEIQATPAVVEGLLHRKAYTDQRIAKAFVNRHTDQKTYKQVLAGLADEFKKEFAQPDQKVTEDQEALRASVRGQENINVTDEKPSPVALSKMTKREFAEYKANLNT